MLHRGTTKAPPRTLDPEIEDLFSMRYPAAAAATERRIMPSDEGFGSE
jgi:hypothetical protein